LAKEWLPMLFVFYPRHEYGCPHVEHCPHLGGASLGSLVVAADGNQRWTDGLLRQVDALREENAAKAQTIAEQQERIEQLERELKAERQRQFKATRGDEEVPAAAIEVGMEALLQRHRGRTARPAALRALAGRLHRRPGNDDMLPARSRALQQSAVSPLTFLDHPRVAPTNNLAEQAVRFLVILRKLTFGSRTRAGARRTGAMMTVIQTAKRQGRNVIRFLVTLFTRTPNEAARAIYARC
jgi:Protein of unknown function (DUF2570)/Transposase IS66 family